eukprot:1143708-Pelagomonas_calceolata.AAC.5
MSTSSDLAQCMLSKCGDSDTHTQTHRNAHTHTTRTIHTPSIHQLPDACSCAAAGAARAGASNGRVGSTLEGGGKGPAGEHVTRALVASPNSTMSPSVRGQASPTCSTVEFESGQQER